MFGTELVKFLTYRTPVLQRLMAPRYRYKIAPGQIAALVGLINATRETNGVVVEIGLAQGDTSALILEHLKTTNDHRKVYLFDTFEGFTEESVDCEVESRGKSRSQLRAFRYGDEAIFSKNLVRAGYSRFETRKGDAAKFDWSSLGPIGAVLLDIDLYLPTIEILNNIWPYVVEGGGVIVDDCLAGTPWDGSLQAYQEFVTAHDLPFRLVGNKGGLVVKPAAVIHRPEV